MFRSSITTFLPKGASRRPLTSKDGNRHYYKGNRCGSMGEWVVNHYSFRVNPIKVRRFIVPDLTDFPLKAYVPWSIPKPKYTFTSKSFFVQSSESTSST